MAHLVRLCLARNRLLHRILFALGTTLLLIFAFHYATTNLLAVQFTDPDEGVYLSVARLLNYGHAYSEFFYDQFWLFPQILALMMRVAGDSVQTGRLTVEVFSMFGLLGSVLLARQLGARWLALLAIPFGIINHYYLIQSRITMADVPSVSLMLWGVVAAIVFAKSKRRVWLIVSAVCCTAGLLIKPLGVAFVLPVAYAIIAARVKREQGRWGINLRALVPDGALFAVFALLTAFPFVNLLNLGAEYQRTVGFHWDETGWYAPSVTLRWNGLLSFIAENRMWFGLAVMGILTVGRRRVGLVMTLVAVELSSAFLLFLLPPWQDHYTLLAPLLTTFAVVGVDRGVRTLKVVVQRVIHAWSQRRALRSTYGLKLSPAMLLVVSGFVLGTALWAHDAPQLAIYNRIILTERAQDVRQVVSYLRKHTSPGDYILSDNPMVVYLAKCLLPPSAVNLPYESTFHISALSREKLLESAHNYPLKAVVVTDAYKRNPELMQWIDKNFPRVNQVGGGRSNTVIARIYTKGVPSNPMPPGSGSHSTPDQSIIVE